MSNEDVLQVVLVANSLPALNDVTAMELPDIVAEAAKVCVGLCIVYEKVFSSLESLFQVRIIHSRT